MTSTSSASAITLPAPNRRAFLGNSLALASAVAATAVPAVAGVGHPDAELVELGRQWAATRRDIDVSDDLTKSLSPAEFEAPEWEIDAEGAALERPRDSRVQRHHELPGHQLRGPGD